MQHIIVSRPYSTSKCTSLTYLPLLAPATQLQEYFDVIKARCLKDMDCQALLVEQLVNQALGRGFINPQAIYFKCPSPLLRPLPPSDALKFINKKLEFYNLLR